MSRRWPVALAFQIAAAIASTAAATPPATAPVPARAAVDSTTAAPSRGDSAVARRRPAFDHGAWHRILAANVDDLGRVAYKRIAEEEESTMRGYLAAVAHATPDGWSRDEQLAFWINAYNAGVVSAILQGESPEKVIDRARLFKSWKFGAAGRRRTLDEIEHEILRKKLNEPRIHFAIVCAATSCPPLRRSAYTADSLTLQLDDQARRFVNDLQRNVVDPTGRRLQLSSIFDWFRSDFEAAAGTLQRFVARYVRDDEARQWLLDEAPQPKFLHYDWSLNQQPFQRPPRPDKQSRR